MSPRNLRSSLLYPLSRLGADLLHLHCQNSTRCAVMPYDDNDDVLTLANFLEST